MGRRSRRKKYKNARGAVSESERRNETVASNTDSDKPQYYKSVVYHKVRNQYDRGVTSYLKAGNDDELEYTKTVEYR